MWGAICKVIGREEWISDPDYATPRARLPRLMEIFAAVEEWTKTMTKFEAMDAMNKFDIPCGPILSMKEIAEEPSLRASGTVVEVDHPERGKYLTVGNPIKLSDSPTEVERSPLLGEHTDEVLRQLGYSAERDRPAARRTRDLMNRRGAPATALPDFFNRGRAHERGARGPHGLPRPGTKYGTDDHSDQS